MGFCAHPAPTWTASACSSLFEARDRIPGRLPGRIRLCPECHGTGRVTSIRRELLLKKVKGWARTNLSVARPARPRKNAGTHTAHVDPPRDYAVRVLRMVSAHKPAPAGPQLCAPRRCPGRPPLGAELSARLVAL